MKFSKIRFENIGPFDNTTLNFSTGNPGLHIVYGSNEAGKSSALKYIEWFLFGIPQQNDDNFKHKFGDFLIESNIIDNNSKTHLLKRRKTPIGRTILDSNNLDATPLLEPMLGGLVRETFSMQFGISHAQLRSGGREVLEGEGELGTMIFEAGAGLANLRKILQQLEERAAEIYPSKNSKLSLTLKEAKENQEEIEKTKLSLGIWQNASELVASLQKKVEELSDEKKAWASKQAECESILRALPQLTKYKTAESTLKELKNIPLLDDATLIKYQAAEKFLTSANALLEQQQKIVLDISTKITNLNPNEKILTVRTEIEALNKSSELLLKNLVDIGNRQKEKDAKEEQIKVLLKDYCTDTSFDESRDLFIDQKTQIQIQELSSLIKSEKTLIEDKEKTFATLLKKIKDLKQDEVNQASHAYLEEVTSLVQTIKAKKLAPSDLEKIASDIPARKLILEAKLNTLTNSSIDWDAFLKLHLPSSEDITGFSKLFTNNLSEAQNLKTEIKGKKEALDDKQKQLSTLRNEGVLLTREELARLRDLRELTWTAIENLLEGRSGTLPEKVTAIVGANASAKNAFLNIQHQSDQFTDKLFTASDQVGRGNQLTQDMAGLEKEIAELEQKLSEAKAAKTEFEKDWQKLWAGIALTKINSPEQMLTWSANAYTLQQSIIEMIPLLENLSLKQNAQSVAFEKLLHLTDTSEIETAWIKAEEIISTAARFEVSKANNKKQLDALVGEQSDLQSEIKTLLDNQKTNHETWAGLMANLKLPGEASTNNASQHVTAITNIHQHHKDAKDLEIRISKMNSDNKEILGKLTKVLETLSIKECPTEAADIKKMIADLWQKASDAKQEEVSQKSLKADLKIAEAALAKIEEEASTHITTLKPLENIPLETLPAHFEEIRKKIKATKDHEDAKNALIQEASGEDIPSLAKKLVDKNSAIIAGELDEVKSKIENCSKARDKELQEFANAKANLERLEKQPGSNILSAERELLKAQCSEQAKEFAMLTLAKSVLEKTIKDYRKTNQDPLLMNANAYLKTLTNNSLVEIVPTDADGKKSLQLLRFGSEDKDAITFEADNIDAEEGTSFLSDGTADQLFLALRLAGIENNLKKLDEPLPVILDDILINFDDARALSTLRCLAEFSSKTQVILFTHHQHLLKLVSGSDFADKVFTHQLG
ncbi:MAG: hypothetical protein DWH70_08905 [Planctomycetota bacterium]|nr:MAG: hypothetical protein DWH70_08905 [Planctomycetota bacterium]